MFKGGLGIQYYQDDIKISRDEFQHLLRQNPQSALLLKKSNAYGAAAIGLFAANLGFSYWYIKETVALDGQINPDLSKRQIPLVGMIGSAFGTIYYSLKRNNAQRDAILTHNRKYDNVRFEPIINEQKLGIVLNF